MAGASDASAALARREGTLGLLFLTPVKSGTVVLGKGIVHMLRAATLWAAALPVLAIPLLLGGVTWLDLASAFAFQFSAMLVALGAGMLASSLSIEPISAVISAELLAIGFAWLLLHGLEVFSSTRMGAAAIGLVTQAIEGSVSRSPFVSGPAWSLAGRLFFITTLLAGSVVIFVVCMWVAARRVRKCWQDRPASARELRWRRFWRRRWTPHKFQPNSAITSCSRRSGSR
jgi:hypothetical protein